jgi:hypothetical protein
VPGIHAFCILLHKDVDGGTSPAMTVDGVAVMGLSAM